MGLKLTLPAAAAAAAAAPPEAATAKQGFSATLAKASAGLARSDQ